MDNYSSLDLDVIKKQIVDNTAIIEAKEYILNEMVSFNPLIIKNNITESKEALSILNKLYVVSFDGIENPNDKLDKVDKSITLEGIDLLKLLVFHNHCQRIKKQFTNFDKELSIRDYTDCLVLDNNAFDKIEKCIDNNGDVKLDASDELRRICKELENTEKALYSRAHQFLDKNMASLQEPSLYVRNDRVVFLFKNSDKNKYGGYTYGSSASGLASYVEPNCLVELNNRKVQLLEDKADEINRILKHLTYILSNDTDLYRRNFDSLVKLNVIFSKAYYGFNRNGIMANISNDNYFDLKDICHPLIDEKKVISNSYRLFSPYKGIVISGSNTGGKTVSLKLIGLAVIMSYLGIPLIASKAEIPLYDNVLVDIDDNQSIEDSLSTFSSHVSNINYILNKANDKSLILIDELVSGTDPKQAQALSLAIIDKIKELGSSFVITTHYDDIKNYSYKDDKILLSSVGFDMDNLAPTYRYLENSIGSSNALEIASRYIDKKDIIDNARFYLKQNETKEDELVNKLANEIEKYQKQNEELRLTNIKSSELNNSLEDKIKRFDLEKQTIRDKYIEELNAYVEDVKDKANEKLRKIISPNNNVIKEIDNLLNNDFVEEEMIEEIVVGDNVRIKENEQIGVVEDIKNDVASINLRGITVKAKLSDLKKMPKVEIKKQKTNKPSFARIPSELNLVGQRVEDGVILMEEYLDKANGANMAFVKVIHGIGTGQLRSALRDKLKKLKYVSKFHDGDFYDGGSAVTIVEFKR